MTEDEPTRGHWGVIATAFAFAWVYAYPEWSAIGNLVSLPGFYQSQLGVTADRVPWTLLVAGVVLPVVVYVAALVLGWKRGAGAVGLYLTTGFALLSAFGLDILALEKDTELRLVIEFLTKS